MYNTELFGTSRGETSKGNGLVMLTKQYDGIRISPALRRPTTSLIELKNVSDEWIAYKTKCTHPTNFTIKPSSCGLLAPNESQLLRLNLLPGYSSELRGVELLLETFFATITNDEIMDAARLWEESVTCDITGTRLAVNVGDTKFNDNDMVTVCFDKFPDGIEKSGTDKMKSVLERMQHEDFVANSLVTLLVVFVVAFFLGYITYKMQCSCDKSTCHDYPVHPHQQ